MTENSKLHLAEQIESQINSDHFIFTPNDDEAFPSLSNMNQFPSVWELDWEKVIKKQLEEEKLDELSPDLPYLFQEEQSLFKNDLLDEVNGLGVPLWFESSSQEHKIKSLNKTDDSLKTTAVPKIHEDNQSDEFFKNKVSEDEEEETERKHKPRTTDYSFTKRPRFSKKQDRGKLSLHQTQLSFALFTIKNFVQLSNLKFRKIPKFTIYQNK